MPGWLLAVPDGGRPSELRAGRDHGSEPQLRPELRPVRRRGLLAKHQHDARLPVGRRRHPARLPEGHRGAAGRRDRCRPGHARRPPARDGPRPRAGSGPDALHRKRRCVRDEHGLRSVRRLGPAQANARRGGVAHLPPVHPDPGPVPHRAPGAGERRLRRPPPLVQRRSGCTATIRPCSGCWSRPGRQGRWPRPRGTSSRSCRNNAAGDKVDFYERRSVSYDVRLLPGGAAGGRAHVEMANTAPSTAPRYVIGPYDSSFRAGENVSFVGLYCGRRCTRPR
jgi:hypothetical protein